MIGPGLEPSYRKNKTIFSAESYEQMTARSQTTASAACSDQPVAALSYHRSIGQMVAARSTGPPPEVGPASRPRNPKRNPPVAWPVPMTRNPTERWAPRTAAWSTPPRPVRSGTTKGDCVSYRSPHCNVGTKRPRWSRGKTVPAPSQRPGRTQRMGRKTCSASLFLQASSRYGYRP